MKFKTIVPSKAKSSHYNPYIVWGEEFYYGPLIVIPLIILFVAFLVIGIITLFTAPPYVYDGWWYILVAYIFFVASLVVTSIDRKD